MIPLGGISLHFPYAHAPGLSQGWKSLTKTEQRAAVLKRLERFSGVMLVDVTDKGEVRLELIEHLPASIRGPLLLDIEDSLKRWCEAGLTVWLEPLGDRNSLRNLRGIEIEVKK